MVATEILAQGVERGIITAEQAERLRALETTGEPPELPASPDDEQLRFIGGFLFARKFPVAITVALALLFELVLVLHIRDNLTLNVIMLIHPFEAIKAWQGGPPII